MKFRFGAGRSQISTPASSLYVEIYIRADSDSTRLAAFWLSPVRSHSWHSLGAIVVNPIARLELLHLYTSAAGSGEIIEAQTGAQQFEQECIKDGETLVLTPRLTRIFLA
jgi:hypothetical protein